MNNNKQHYLKSFSEKQDDPEDCPEDCPLVAFYSQK